MTRKLVVELDVSDPSEVAEGVFVTHLTHPKLEGSLSFSHSVKVESSVLEALRIPEEDPIKKLIELTIQASEILGFRT